MNRLFAIDGRPSFIATKRQRTRCGIQYSLKESATEADWLIGEGIPVLEPGKAPRSMTQPGTTYSGDRQPDHMDDYVDLPVDNDPRNDTKGPHINSGIANHVFCLGDVAGPYVMLL